MSLEAALASRRRFVDLTAATVEGTGTGTTPGAAAERALFQRIKSSSGHVGLINLGATCYLNSLLQTLYMTPGLRRAVFEWSYDDAIHGPLETSLPAQLQLLFTRLAHTAAAATSTKALCSSFGWQGNEAFRQHDVNECFLKIFDFVKEECSGSPLAEHTSTAWEGKTIDYIHCTETDSVRYAGGATVTFRTVQLQAEGMASIAESFECFVRPERFQLNNDALGRRTASDKGMHFVSLPTHLCLQLKRFKFDWSTSRSVKVPDEVSFPETLDLTRFLPCVADLDECVLDEGVLEPQHEEDFARTASAAEGDGGSARAVRRAAASEARAAGLPLLARGERARWALTSIMVHVGTIRGGHYYAYIKDRDSQSASATDDAERAWYCFNDATVTRLDDKALRSAKGAMGAKNAYCLLYTRIVDGGEADAGGGGADRERAARAVPRAPPHLRALVEEENAAFDARRAAFEHEQRMLELFIYSPARCAAPVLAAALAAAPAISTAAMASVPTAATLEDMANANKVKKKKKKKKSKKQKQRSAGAFRSSAMPIVAGMTSLRVRVHDGESVETLLRSIRAEAQAAGSTRWWGVDEAGGEPSVDRMRLRHLNTTRALPEAALLAPERSARETTLAALREAQAPPRRALQPRLPLYLEVRSSADAPWEVWQPSLSIRLIAVAYEDEESAALAEGAAARGGGAGGGGDRGARKTVYAAPVELLLREAAPTVADLRVALAQHCGGGGVRAGGARASERGFACAPWRLLLLRDGEGPLVLLDAQPLLGAPLALRSGATVHAERAASARYADVHSADAATSRVLADYTAALNLATFAFNELDPLGGAGGAVAPQTPQTLVLHSIVQAPDMSNMTAMPMPASAAWGMPMPTMPSVPVLPPLPGAPASGPALPPMPALPPPMGMPGVPSAAMPALAAPARALLSVQIDVRRPMSALRELIAAQLGAPPTTFKLQRTSFSAEVKLDARGAKTPKSVSQCGLRDGDRLFAVSGAPLRSDERRWVVWLHADEPAAAATVRTSAPTGAPITDSIVLRKLGDDLVVSKSATPLELREAIIARFGASCSAMAAALARCGGSPYALRLREKSLSALTKVYDDGFPLASKRNAGAVADGKEVVVQLLREGEGAEPAPFTSESVLLRLRGWLPAQCVLLPPFELALSAQTTVLDLRKRLAAAAGASRAKDVTFARPLPWQLREKHALPGLPWGCHGRFKDSVALGELHLENGTLLAFKDGCAAEDAALQAEAAAAAAAAAACCVRERARGSGGGAEVAFKIYTRAEQEERAEEEKKKDKRAP